MTQTWKVLAGGKGKGLVQAKRTKGSGSPSRDEGFRSGDGWTDHHIPLARDGATNLLNPH